MTDSHGRAMTQEVSVDGVRVFVRRTEGEGPLTVFVHGNPTHSEDWAPFLERLDGPALAFDIPGWGRSERPPASAFDYSMSGLAGFLRRLIDTLEIDEYRLVCHDWGVLGLIASLERPERVKRLVLINCVPILPGYRWHWVARLWRRRGVGEAFNLLGTKPGFRLISRQASGRPGPMPAEFLDTFWEQRPRGTGRQILTLYRSADPDRLAAAGERLGELRCPALVAWGVADPYLPARFARAYAERLANAELLELDRAGHWPWIDRPELVDRVVGFLDGDGS